MKLRPANEEQDAAVIQTLYDAFFPSLVPNASTILKSQSVRVAESPDGTVVGFRAVAPTQFIWVAVAPEHQRQGIGTLLMNDALEHAAESSFTELNSRVKESNAGSMAFCARFGFKPYLHMINLELDLADWQDAARVPNLHEVTAKGITFKTYADYGDTAPNRQRLYELNKALSATVPRAEPQIFMDFETYVERQLLRDALPHEGIFLAVDGEHDDRWIGMSQISLREGCSFVEMTGVLPDYRGRGIAQDLKRLTLQFAQSNHRTIIKTFNDVTNAPMIAVNERAGFRRGERFYFMRRKLR